MRLACLTALLGMALPLAATAATFDAVTEFSSSNPSGSWAYGTGVTGSSFTPMSVFSAVCNGITRLSCWQPPSIVFGVPVVAYNSGSTINNGTVVLPPGVLDVHPGPAVDTIVTWTSPAAGVYSISGFFELLDVSPSGVIGQVYNGSTSLFTSILTGPGAVHPDTAGQRKNFSFVETLAAGSTLSFGVNNDGNFLFDSTGFDATITSGTTPTVPEPSSFVLFVAGLCGLGYWRLRSRSVPAEA